MIYIHVGDTNLNQTFTVTLNEQVCTCTLNYSISTNEWYFSLSYIDEQQVDVVQYRKIIPGQFIISRNAEYTDFDGDFYVSDSFAQGSFDYKAWSKGYRLYYMTYRERMNKKLLEAFIYENRFFSAPFIPLEQYKPGELNLHSLSDGEAEIYRGVFTKRIVNNRFTNLVKEISVPDVLPITATRILIRGDINPNVFATVNANFNALRLRPVPISFIQFRFELIPNNSIPEPRRNMLFKEWLQSISSSISMYFLIENDPVLYTFPFLQNLRDIDSGGGRRLRQEVRLTTDLWNRLNSISNDTKVLIVIAKEGSVQRV